MCCRWLSHLTVDWLGFDRSVSTGGRTVGQSLRMWGCESAMETHSGRLEMVSAPIGACCCFHIDTCTHICYCYRHLLCECVWQELVWWSVLFKWIDPVFKICSTLQGIHECHRVWHMRGEVYFSYSLKCVIPIIVKRLSTTFEDWNCFPRPDGCIWHSLAQRPTGENFQNVTSLDHWNRWTTAPTPKIPCPHGWCQQLLEEAEQWPTTGICACSNTVQPLHQWPSSHHMSEIHICWWHMPCLPSRQLWRPQLYNQQGHRLDQ